MTAAVLPAPTAATATRPGEVDNRATYVSFGLAYVLGHGATAVSTGASPLVTLPNWLPTALLGLGLAAGTVYSTLAALRAQRGVGKADVFSARLLGLSWIVGFSALFFAITGLTSTVDAPGLSTMLWPAGSGLVVGLLYLAEGSVRRNVLHYGLGVWLTLVSAMSFAFGTPGLFWILAVAGGGGYAVATVLEHRRLSH